MQTGILLLHGFAGTRKELEPLRTYLEECGFVVSVPVLAGHELTRKDLARSKYTEWINSAREAANDLKARCDKLIVVGFSMGGLIAVNLFCDFDIEKLVLMNTPVYYWDFSRIIKNLLSNFKNYIKNTLMPVRRNHFGHYGNSPEY